MVEVNGEPMTLNANRALPAELYPQFGICYANNLQVFRVRMVWFVSQKLLAAVACHPIPKDVTLGPTLRSAFP